MTATEARLRIINNGFNDDGVVQWIDGYEGWRATFSWDQVAKALTTRTPLVLLYYREEEE
jgi:hypothetical protein